MSSLRIGTSLIGLQDGSIYALLMQTRMGLSGLTLAHAVLSIVISALCPPQEFGTLLRRPKVSAPRRPPKFVWGGGGAIVCVPHRCVRPWWQAAHELSTTHLQWRVAYESATIHRQEWQFTRPGSATVVDEGGLLCGPICPACGSLGACIGLHTVVSHQ